MREENHANDVIAVCYQKVNMLLLNHHYTNQSSSLNSILVPNVYFFIRGERQSGGGPVKMAGNYNE